MSIIKDIYDLAKDATKLKGSIGRIKRALRTELKLNKKFLADIEKAKNINDIRRKQIISMLDTSELSAVVNLELPYELICRKKVDFDLAEELRIKRILDFDFEKLVEQLYIMISYIKKDSENTDLDLNRRLIFIYKYNNALIRLLS